MPGVTGYPCKVGGGNRSTEDCLLAECAPLLVRLGDNWINIPINKKEKNYQTQIGTPL